ncbi:MAG TPA: TIGR03085 family metal-binding protein [Blastococcus sp.]|nr:TIGR03085 family metal-binding protein [Blastococcus sp.]
MTASSPPLVDRERRELADLLRQLGPDAPTCCAGWTTAHLAAHLVVRDRRPDAMLGYGLEGAGLGGPAVAWTHRAEDRLRTSTGYAELVTRVRSGPPGWLPMSWPPVARLINLSEFAIHDEDVRRAQPGWEPRTLAREDQDAIWSASGLYARRAAGRRGVVLRRTDGEGEERRLGAGGRVVEGEPLELLLWAAGRRDVARVQVS